MRIRILSLAACAALACAAASAHVVLDYQAAPAGSSYRATFKVGHGCGASATRQITVDIPAGVRNAHPMPKPGWQLTVERAPLPKPETDHGRTVTDDVARVTWTARTRDDMLPNAHYDEFVLSARLPQQAGTIYWPVRQVCEEGRNDWVEVPAAGQKRSDLKSPAALLEVLPVGGAGAHNH
jgi:uncharacterized protein YcnI